jgi:hypothetical protein
VLLQVNDFACIRGRISIPLTGTWVADVSIDPATSSGTQPTVGTPVTLAIGECGFTLSGTVVRINDAFGTLFARIVGGGGGLGDDLDPKAYQNVSFGLVLKDILGQVGETLSTQTPSAILDLQLPFWTVMAGPANEAVYNLLIVARVMSGEAINWRVLSDGTIFMGEEQWPTSSLTEFDLLTWLPSQLSATFYSTNPDILPGQAWQSGFVANVEHVLEPERFRSKVWWLNPTQ